VYGVLGLSPFGNALVFEYGGQRSHQLLCPLVYAIFAGLHVLFRVAYMIEFIGLILLLGALDLRLCFFGTTTIWLVLGVKIELVHVLYSLAHLEIFDLPEDFVGLLFLGVSESQISDLFPFLFLHNSNPWHRKQMLECLWIFEELLLLLAQAFQVIEVLHHPSDDFSLARVFHVPARSLSELYVRLEEHKFLLPDVFDGLEVVAGVVWVVAAILSLHRLPRILDV